MNKKLAIPMAAIMIASQIQGITSINASEQIVRISGTNRFSTSAEISKKTFEKSEYVVLANGAKYQDALSGSVLAEYLNAPILLTEANKLPSETESEIARLGAKKIYVLGGENSVSEKIFNDLSKKYEVKRIYGRDRYETSLNIAKILMEKGRYNNVAIASGKVFADALSSAPAMAKNKMPIILTDGTNLPNISKEKIKYIIGGESTINANGLNAKRIAGRDRYETSAKVAKEFFNGSNEVVISSGEAFTDTLSASSYSIKNNAPILLVKKDTLPSSIKDSVDLKNKKITIVGGISTVSSSLENEIKGTNKKVETPDLSTHSSRHSSGGGKKVVVDKEDSEHIKELKDKIEKIEKVINRVDENDVVIENKPDGTVQDKTKVKEEMKNRLNELKDFLNKNNEISEEKYQEIKKELSPKHGFIGNKGFVLKMDVEGDKVVKGKKGDEEAVAKYIRVKKDQDGKYKFKIISSTEGLKKYEPSKNDEKKDDSQEVKKYIKLNYVTEENFNDKKIIEKDPNRELNRGNIDVITNPTPKYKKTSMSTDGNIYEVQKVEGGYEITINELPEGTVIVKPVIIDKLEDGSVLEMGTLVFIERVTEEN